MNRRLLRRFTAAIAPACVALGCGHVAACAPRNAPHRFTLATTTSVDNSGLLGALLPVFRSHTGIDVQVLTPGSGIALEMLADGDVDAAISHAPAREAAVLERIRDAFYRKVMFNDFVLVGPPDDPAGVEHAPTAEEAMRRIARARARFISRGDSSGTHERERELWARAGVVPDTERVVMAGGGMGATLRIAGTMGAYTLTDRGTWAQHAGRARLRIVFEGGADLLNTYAVIVGTDAQPDARRFAEWLADGEGRRLIAEYRTVGGTPAFMVWPAGCPADSPAAQPCGTGSGDAWPALRSYQATSASSSAARQSARPRQPAAAAPSTTCLHAVAVSSSNVRAAPHNCAPLASSSWVQTAWAITVRPSAGRSTSSGGPIAGANGSSIRIPP
jgi:tungstate transport system substrate-binding protein